MDALLDLDVYGADLSLAGPDLATDHGLRSAVVISLMSDRRADPDDVLPGGDDRRGWWADAFPDEPNDRIGSRLWLLSREKQTPDVLFRAEEYAREALDWLLSDGIATRVDVQATNAGNHRLDIVVTIYRPGSADPVNFTYQFVWEDFG